MPSEDDAGLDYVCPNCNEPVDPEWSACPACGVEFLPPEGEQGPASSPAKAAAGGDGGLSDLDKEFNAEFADTPPKAAPPAAPKDDLSTLQKDIKGQLGKMQGKAAPPPPAKGQGPPARTKGMAPPPPPKKGGPPPKGKAAKGKAPASAPKKGGPFGGTLGMIGLLLLLAGVVGVVVVANWDTLVAGASQNSVGTLQLIGIIGAVSVAAVGLLLLLISKRKAKKGAGAA
jgi:hypothetical protein